MGARLGNRSNKQPEPEINVTPLVDVVLVLLIIFMVIAPALNEGEHIELPSVLKADPKPKDLNPIDVTVALNGKVIVDKQPIAQAEMESTLRRLHESDPERKLLLNTDERLPYESVRKNFAMLQKIGFKGISLKVLEAKKAGDGA
jgi:biopolymer transport protein ExbD/biopolymer transport protein TolR